MSTEAAGAAGAPPPPPPPAAAAALPPIPPSRSVSSFASEAELQEDVALYADLPLGSASSVVLENGGSDAPEGAALTAGRRRYLCYFRHRCEAKDEVAACITAVGLGWLDVRATSPAACAQLAGVLKALRCTCAPVCRYLEFRLPEMEALADAARRRLDSRQRRGAAGSSSSDNGSGGNGSGEASDGTAEVPSGPAVVWEKPFGNRVREPAAAAAAVVAVARCIGARSAAAVTGQHS